MRGGIGASSSAEKTALPAADAEERAPRHLSWHQYCSAFTLEWQFTVAFRRVIWTTGDLVVQETGVHNGAFGADKFGLRKLKAVNWNFGAPQLYEHSLSAGEAVLSADGALCADTGEFTGRSPKDKFTVRDATTDKNMWWAGNQSITSEQFESLYKDFLTHAEGMTLFAQDLYGGADPSVRTKTRVFTELAWHSLFIRTLLIRPEASELENFVPELTIIDLPSFRADPKRHGVRSENVVAIDFARKIVLIGGSYYAGEMKKSVFTTLNYYLPEKGVMPMHCSANV